MSSFGLTYGTIHLINFFLCEKSFKKTLSRYANDILFVYSVLLLFRAIEIAFIIRHHKFDLSVLKDESFGFCCDLVHVSVFLLGCGAIALIVGVKGKRLMSYLSRTFLAELSMVFFLIIKYFMYQFVPLDLFIYNYSVQEIQFTLSTANTSYNFTWVAAVCVALFVLGLRYFISRQTLSSRKSIAIYSIFVLSLVFFIPVHNYSQNVDNKFTLNKPLYFISRSWGYYWNKNTKIEPNIAEFQGLFSEKEFVSECYPLLHKTKKTSSIAEYFVPTDTAPNIVILIVEGLNSDFVNTYKGATLMPFLSDLKDSSLYWKNCFSHGERSFAAVPSLLGGLPFGDRGFTNQDVLPTHISLVSLLKQHGYYTSFYYGQEAWFYRKDHFFKYNKLDNLFDRSCFSKEFELVEMDKRKSGWGYNDKDLFKQSMQVIDTLSAEKRLDVYFTVTSHTPFIITNEDYYQKRLEECLKSGDVPFYNNNHKMLKSIMFTDDALNDFFAEYKRRKDYANTIFVITGDHPMTELPRENALKKYNVPLLVYSPKLVRGKAFKALVCHSDVYQTLIELLTPYLNYTPEFSTSVGDVLCGNLKQRNMAFMNENREVVDFLSEPYFLSRNQLFKVRDELCLKKIENDSIKNAMQLKLDAFQDMSLYVCRNNRLMSKELYRNLLGFSTKTDSTQFKILEIGN